MTNKQIKNLQNKIKKADRKTKSAATRLINKFIILNQDHAVTSKEKYGMTYGYHNECAIEAQKEKIKVLILFKKELFTFYYEYYDLLNMIERERKVLKHLKLMLEIYKEKLQ